MSNSKTQQEPTYVVFPDPDLEPDKIGPARYGSRVVPSSLIADVSDPRVPFDARLWIVVTAGDARVIDIRLTQRTATDRITSAGLSKVRLAAWLAEVIRSAPDWSDRLTTEAGTWVLGTDRRGRDDSKPTKQSRMYEVAVRYRAAVERRSKSPVADVARSFDPPLERDYVAHLLVMARSPEVGLLPPAPGRGRSGFATPDPSGEPTRSADDLEQEALSRRRPGQPIPKRNATKSPKGGSK